MKPLDRSQALLARGERVIPLAAQTMSKTTSQFVQGVAPVYLERGEGSHVWDVDGNEYVDYPMALGPIILGYREPVVDDAIRAQLDAGITFSLSHPLEIEVAERITSLCPGVEAVRFGKSGSDAVSAAVRAARALTGRSHVLVAGYHGWHDWYIASTTRNVGVPAVVERLVSSFAFNDLAALEAALDEHEGDVAAVIVEPAGADAPLPGYLDELVDRVRHRGAISIFDEVITGFRIAVGGARERYGVIPDLSCYGKALGNGMPISAVAGSWPVMKVFEEVFFSGTHGGETLSLAAAAAVLDTLADGTVLAGINARGVTMKSGIAAAIDRHGVGHRVRVGGEPERAVVGFGGEDHLVVRSWLQQVMIDAGILFNGSMFICARHSEDDVERALAAFDTAFAELAHDADVSSLLRGPAVQPVFRAP